LAGIFAWKDAMHAQVQPQIQTVTTLKPASNRAVTPPRRRLTHLARLEAESIHIFREVAAEFAKPILMYSIGKDSSVLLHLARKAFFPGRIPFPLLHIDTGWKFKEMIRSATRPRSA
jgi:sulfate adenylyltransferase subunit 2